MQRVRSKLTKRLQQEELLGPFEGSEEYETILRKKLEKKLKKLKRYAGVEEPSTSKSKKHKKDKVKKEEADEDRSDYYGAPREELVLVASVEFLQMNRARRALERRSVRRRSVTRRRSTGTRRRHLLAPMTSMTRGALGKRSLLPSYIIFFSTCSEDVVARRRTTSTRSDDGSTTSARSAVVTIGASDAMSMAARRHPPTTTLARARAISATCQSTYVGCTSVGVHMTRHSLAISGNGAFYAFSLLFK